MQVYVYEYDIIYKNIRCPQESKNYHELLELLNNKYKNIKILNVRIYSVGFLGKIYKCEYDLMYEDLYFCIKTDNIYVANRMFLEELNEGKKTFEYKIKKLSIIK